jgi:hypothetical protein
VVKKIPFSRFSQVKRNYGLGKEVGDLAGIMFSKKETAVQTNSFLTDDILFSVDRCLLMGDTIGHTD